MARSLEASMREALALALAQLAIALLYGAERRRRSSRWPFLHSHARARAAQALAAVLVAVATLLWNGAEPGPAAFLAVPVALMAAGTIATLLAASWPRLTWWLMAAAPIAALFGSMASGHE
jgi:hypothetical protein